MSRQIYINIKTELGHLRQLEAVRHVRNQRCLSDNLKILEQDKSPTFTKKYFSLLLYVSS